MLHDSSDRFGPATMGRFPGSAGVGGVEFGFGVLGGSGGPHADGSQRHEDRHPPVEAATPLEASAGRRDFRALPEVVPEDARPDEGLFLPVGHRRVQQVGQAVGRHGPRGRRQLRLQGLSGLPEAGGRAHGVGREGVGHEARLHGRRGDGDRPRRRAVSQDPGGGMGALAQADQVRLARAQDGGGGARGR